jgi:glycosyltransferase involved in cell wall biosynthesis
MLRGEHFPAAVGNPLARGAARWWDRAVRIGMDYRPAMRPRTGIGRYAGSLAAALAPRCDLRLYGVFFRGNRRAVRIPPPGARLTAWPVPARLMKRLGRLGLLPADRAVGGCDLFHHTNYILPEVGRKTPQVMTLHDLAFLRDPTCHAPRAAEALTGIVTEAAHRCAAFLTPSEATAHDCEELLGIPRERLFVTPLGVDPAFFELCGDTTLRPYVLAVGTLEPRKNHARLIRAFGRLGGDVDLRIVGRRGWLDEPVLDAAAATKSVHLMGHVSEPELRALVAGALVVAYPSLLEGFGLPVLEALAAGRPVLTSDREPLCSLAGDAALLVDPTSEESIADGLERLLSDAELRSELARRGPERARRFTWERCAEATLEVYREVGA